MNIIKTVKDKFSKKNIIFDLAKNDFKKRIVGSYFGVVWMFIQPIVTILIYYIVFQKGFRSAPIEGIPYVVWLIPGIVPWFFFNEALSTATNSLYEYNYLVKKVVFKISILPVVKVLSAAYVHFIFVFLMLVTYLLFGYRPEIHWIQIIYYSFCAYMLSLGLSYITASVNVFFKDMAQIVGIILQFGMWLTPIMYHYSLLDAYSWHWILKLNPMYYIVEGYRNSMLLGVWFWENPKLTLYFWVVVIIIFVIGTKLFKKLKPHFADVL